MKTFIKNIGYPVKLSLGLALSASFSLLTFSALASVI
jgi:hypothetical protein